MLGDAARDRGPVVQTAGLSLLLDENKSGSASHWPARSAQAGWRRTRGGAAQPRAKRGFQGSSPLPCPTAPSIPLGARD